MKEKILAAMSGGVDSSAVALLLLQDGFEVLGGTMKLLPEKAAQNDIDDAERICRQLDIEHHVFDMCEEFSSTIIDNFISVYESGGTPNPCILCNKYLKFGALLDRAISLGADKIATGHYAQIEKAGDRYLIKRAKDTSKDQSYVLWMLSQHQLSHTALPLGDKSKSDIRELAECSGLITAHKSDSQDICFVPDGKYAEFIQRNAKTPVTEGNFVDTDGKILGRHKGIIHYTVGQRKGLGLSFGMPMFVRSKNAQTNEVTLTSEGGLYVKEIKISSLNLVAADSFDAPVHAEVKTRYSQIPVPATIVQSPDDPCDATIIFDEPQRAAARGQSAVFYDGDTLLGGGVIV